MNTRDFYIETLDNANLSEMAEFVVTENFKHHEDSVNVVETKQINNVIEEEKVLFNTSVTFIAKNKKMEMIGSIRVARWNFLDELPIEKLFNISPFQLMHRFTKSNVWHIGRFAIKSGIRQITLFKVLMINAIAPICENKNSIAFAECDSKLLRILKMLGIKVNVVGNPIYYLGSETIPIAMTYEGLINFYKKNSNLLKKEQVKTGNKVKTDYTKV